MKSWTKHLIECKCILPQFKDVNPPVYHKFVVFSELEEETGEIKKSLAQCNNCGVIHKIKEIGQSEILKKEDSLAIPKISEIKQSIPDWLSQILEQNNIDDLPTWQQARFIIDNGLWGQIIVLAKEQEDDLIITKYVIILGKTLYKIETDQQEITKELF